MRQLTYVKKNQLEWWDVPEPELQSATDTIVRPIAAARCDGDKIFLFHDVTTLMRIGTALHYLDPVTTDGLGSRPYQAPIAVGHECVGEVISCGGDVTNVRPGELVVVPWAISCGACTRCAAGLTSRCEMAGDTYLSGYGFGTPMGPWGGMVSDLIRVPFANMLVPVPDGVSATAAASTSDNIPDAWRTVAPFLQQRPGVPVLVIGGGAESIGLYAAAIAVALGSEQVTYLDSSDARLDIAAAVGATPIKIPEKGRSGWFRRNMPRRGGHYPITVDAAANEGGGTPATATRKVRRTTLTPSPCIGRGELFRKTTGLRAVVDGDRR